MKKNVKFLFASLASAVIVLTSCGPSEAERKAQAEAEQARIDSIAQAKADSIAEVKAAELARQKAEEEAIRQKKINSTAPSSVAQKIRMGESMEDIDFEVMIRYCKNHNEDASVIFDDILSGNCGPIEADMMINTLYERYPYLELFLSCLGANRDKLTQEQMNRCTEIVNEIEKQSSRIKNRNR